MKKILVLFPNEWDREELGRSRYRDRYRFRFAGFDLFRYHRVKDELAFEFA